MAVASKIYIGNLALGKLGVSAMGRLSTAQTEFSAINSKNAAAIGNCYDNLREAELRRNYWAFAISRRVIRAIATTDKIWTPATWLVGSTYALNDIVILSGVTYISLAAGNIGNAPATATTYWAIYWGPLTSSEWDDGLSYYRGEVVHVSTATWLCLSYSTAGETPSEGTEWHEITGETQVATTYRAPLTGRTYGFVKPRDFLRLAPNDPRMPKWMPDYLFEGDLIITNDPGPLDLRYVRNEKDTTKFDSLFDQGLASRIAVETCEEITQSTSKVATAEAMYQQVISDARLVNAIEGYEVIEPDEDEWITVRS
jgi:hypothetical protein